MSFPVTRQRLLSLLDAFAGRRVAVAGDFVVDRFIHGSPKRISREAPVLILRYVREDSVPGGGANTAANVAALSGRALPAGAVGLDEEGKLLRSLFDRRMIDTARLVAVKSYPTPTKTRILGGGVHSIKQQIVRLDREEPLAEDGAVTEALRRNLIGAASEADVLVLSDYGYGSARPEWLAEVRRARPGIPVLVDSRFRLPEFAGADAATPNEEELERTFPEPLDDSEERFELAGRSLLARLRSRALLGTRGSRGMAHFEASGPTRHIPVFGTDQVADVTGAGDTVMAAFALSIAAGATYLEAALLANTAGGLVVMKMGTATVTREELAGAVASGHLPLS
jgi:rfaE bifunctional protein kinase chain/domain